MNLGELLEELRANVLRDVTDEIQAQTDGFIWTDASLIRYLNDAQEQFAKDTLFLRDETTTDITRIALVEGQETYALDSRVLAVFGARVGASYHLARTTYAGLFSTRGDMTLAGPVLDCASYQKPVRFYTDRESGKVGVYPAPSADYAGQELILRVARLPLVPLAATDLDAEPEVPRSYHMDLVEWAAYRALRNHDTDGENMAKANTHKKRFEDSVRQLKLEAKRLLAQDIQFDVRSNWG